MAFNVRNLLASGIQKIRDLDRDKSMSGFQLAQGGLTNRVTQSLPTRQSVSNFLNKPIQVNRTAYDFGRNTLGALSKLPTSQYVLGRGQETADRLIGGYQSLQQPGALSKGLGAMQMAGGVLGLTPAGQRIEAISGTLPAMIKTTSQAVTGNRITPGQNLMTGVTGKETLGSAFNPLTRKAFGNEGGDVASQGIDLLNLASGVYRKGKFNPETRYLSAIESRVGKAFHPQDAGDLDKVIDSVRTNFNKKKPVKQNDQMTIDNLADEYLPHSVTDKIRAKYKNDPDRIYLEIGKKLQKEAGDTKSVFYSKINTPKLSLEPNSQSVANSLNPSLPLPTKPGTLKQLQQQAQTNVKTDPLSSPKVYQAEANPKTQDKITLREAQDQKITAQNDYKQWQKSVFQQEGAKNTAKGNLNQQLKKIGSEIKTGTNPGGVKTENLKDISGFKSYTRDVYRNFKEVYGKNFDGIKRSLLDPFDKSKGDLTRAYKNWSNRVSSEVEQGLGIKKGSKESAAVQLYGEGKLTDIELVKQFGEKKANQIKMGDQWFRKEYDKLLGEVNATMKRVYPNNPEKQIPRRSDYYRHFKEMSQGISGLLNIFDSPANISSSLAGTSEFTRPKSKWLSFAQKRLGKDTEIDAVGGFLDYVKSAEYNKNIDPHTAKFRALAEDLALQTTDDPKVNNFIEYLNDYANDLAGKTNPADRFVQKIIPGGRKTMSAISWLNNRIKANVILGNASSSIAQIFNVPQGIADAGPKYSAKGLGSSIANIFGEKTPITKSNFITERYGGNAFDRFDRGMVNNGRKFAAWMTGALDEVGTKYIWNSQYQKALGEGIQDAVKFADDKTRNLVAGRGIGEVPLIQKSKVFQLVAPFQLEVANLWHVMGDWVGEKQFGKLATFMLASYAFNRGAEAIRGSDVSFDPIQASIEAYNAYSEEEDKKTGAFKAGGRLAGEVLSNVPLGQTIAASYDEYGGGALGSVMKGLTGDTVTREEFFGKGDPTRFGSGLLLTKGLQDPLYKIIPPYGGQQMKRTIDGANATSKGYSESATGRVRFPTENTTGRNIQRAVFGEYSTPNARQYFDSDTSTLGDKQSEAFKSMPKDEANKYYNQILNNRKVEKKKKTLKDSLIKKAGASEQSGGEYSYIRKSDGSLQTITTADIKAMPSTSNLQKVEKNKAVYGAVKDVMNSSLKPEEKESALKELGVNRKDAVYYTLATKDVNEKYAFVQDVLEKENPKSPKELMNLLVPMVYEVNGKKILTDDVVDDLYNAELINKNDKKYLKSIKAEGTKLTRKSSGGSTKSMITDSEILKSYTQMLQSMYGLDKSQQSETKGKKLSDYYASRRKSFKLK